MSREVTVPKHLPEMVRKRIEKCYVRSSKKGYDWRCDHCGCNYRKDYVVENGGHCTFCSQLDTPRHC